MQRYTWILTLTLAVACGDDKNTTTDATTGGSTTDATSTSTSTTSTNPTSTDPSGTMGGSQTMGETTDVTTVGPGTATDATSTSGSTGEPGSTGGSTTGGGSADIPGACKAVCDKGVTECMIADIGMTADECTMGCVNDLGGGMGACAEATVAYLDCLADLGCDALSEAVINDNPGLCLDAAIAAGMACDGGGACTTGVNINDTMTSCSVTVECPNMPLQEMQCMGKQCVCLVDGQKAGMCMANDVCMTPDMLEQKAVDCCGF